MVYTLFLKKKIVFLSPKRNPIPVLDFSILYSFQVLQDSVLDRERGRSWPAWYSPTLVLQRRSTRKIQLMIPWVSFPYVSLSFRVPVYRIDFVIRFLLQYHSYLSWSFLFVVVGGLYFHWGGLFSNTRMSITPLDSAFSRLSVSSTSILCRVSGVVNPSTRKQPPTQHAELLNPTLVDLPSTGHDLWSAVSFVCIYSGPTKALVPTRASLRPKWFQSRATKNPHA